MMGKTLCGKSRRLLIACCACVFALCLVAGCSSGKSSEAEQGADSGDLPVSDVAAQTDASQADAGGSAAPAATGGQTVTFPAAYFQGASTPDAAIAQLESLGCADIVDNGDGTYTASLSADAYNQVVNDSYEQVMQAIAELEAGTTYPNVQEVSYEEGFGNIQVKLGTDMPGLEDTYAMAAVGVPASTYQQIAGLPVGCQVDLVLQDDTVQQSTVFPL